MDLPGIQDASEPELWLDSFDSADAERVAMDLEQGLCRIRPRGDLVPGEVAILRARPREGAVRVPWTDFLFRGRRRSQAADRLKNVQVVSAGGSALFPATDETILELRQGPHAGACEIAFDGRTLLVDLRRGEAGTLALRMGDFATLADPQAARVSAEPAGLPMLAQQLAGMGPVGTLTVARKAGWIARRVAPLGTPLIDRDELLARGLGAAVETLAGWQRAGRIGKLAIAVENSASMALLEKVVESGARGVTALLPAQVDGFEREGGYSASVMAAGAIADLARRAGERHWSFDVAGEDDSVAGLLTAAGAGFRHLAAPLPEPRWGTGSEVLTVAVVGHSEMARVRAHLVSALMLLRQELGGKVRLLLPADEAAGADIAREFGVDGLERYHDFAGEVGAASGPAVALAVYPDAGMGDAAIEASALGYVPVLGPACLRWADGTDREADAARFRIGYWEDPRIVAAAARAVLDDWQGATVAWERLREAELARIAETRALIWGAATGAGA